MKLPTSEGVVNEWNMVGGYYDLLYRLLHHYYQASLTPGITDDIEALKRVVDHCYCKLEGAKYPHFVVSYINSKEYKIPLIYWLDGEIREVENKISFFEKKRLQNVKPSPNDYMILSDAKKQLREVHRVLMLKHQVMGDFDKSRIMRGKQHAFAQFGGFDDEE